MRVHLVRDQGPRSYMEDRDCAVSLSLPMGEYTVFGVFDGHGGSEVADLIAKTLPDIVTRHLDRVSAARGGSTHSNIANGGGGEMAEIAALREAFLEADEHARARIGKQKQVGSTACVTVLVNNNNNNNRGSGSMVAKPSQGTQGTQGTQPSVVDKTPARHHSWQGLWVANSGDSRCVLRTRDQVMQMSSDHKPEAPAEMDRIQEAGGVVLNISGVHRVMGNLSLSRSLGDWYMRPYVIPHPAVSQWSPAERVKGRPPKDHRELYLLLATDGLWDVFTSAEACAILDRGQAWARQPNAALVELVRTARVRGSEDNITVMLVDLRHPKSLSL